MHERRNAKRGAARLGIALLLALALGACDRDRGEAPRAEGGKGGHAAGQSGTGAAGAGGKADGAAGSNSGGEGGTPAEAGAGGVAGATGQSCPPGAAGERVVCADGIVVTFPAGVLPDGATVTVSRTNEKDFQDAFENLFVLSVPAVRLPGEIRINTGDVFPERGTVRVQIDVPPGLVEDVPPDEVSVLVLVEQASDNESSLLSVDPFPTVFDRGLLAVEANLPFWVFSENRLTRGGHEAVVTVARLPRGSGLQP